MYNKFFHYTSFETYMGIKSAFEIAEDWCSISPYLKPKKKMIPPRIAFNSNNDNLANESAVFGLLEREPQSWWELEFSRGTPVIQDVLWDISTSHKYQIVLLEVSVEPEDEVYVADWGVHLDKDYKGTRGTPHKILSRVKSAYADSLIPLSEYSDDMNYTLPEVVCFSEIPFNRIKRVDQDNLLMLTERVRLKYGYSSTGIALNKQVPEYTCPIHFEY